MGLPARPQADEVYVSTDIESDGPIPGPHSMLSLGSAAFTAAGTLLATFSVNLETLPGAAADPDVMAWWGEHPEAYAATRADLEAPDLALRRYCAWLEQLPGMPVFVGYPAGYDFMFVYWYLMTFAGTSPFGRRALDARTYAMAVLGTSYGAGAREALPSRWLPQSRHTHVALDDAVEQGQIFCAMLQERLHTAPSPGGA